eukprot:290594-Hanusia_phi.AAC.1
MSGMRDNTKLKKLLEYAERLSKKGDSNVDGHPTTLQYYNDNTTLIMEQDLPNLTFDKECVIIIRREDLDESVFKYLHALCNRGTNETLILGIGLMRLASKGINHPLILFEMTCHMQEDFFYISPVADMEIQIWNFETLFSSPQDYDKLKEKSLRQLEEIKNPHPNSDELYGLIASIGKQITCDFIQITDPREGKEYYLNNENYPTSLEILRNWVIYKPSNSNDANSFCKLLDSRSDVVPAYCKDIIDGPSHLSQAACQQPTSFLLPLPYNTDQLRVLKLLSNSNVVVVEGPPGTGKTHTIGRHADQMCSLMFDFVCTANIACHLISQGKKILITSHGIHALSVMKKKIEEAVPWLAKIAISWEGSKRDMLDQLVEATKRLNEVQNISFDCHDINNQLESLNSITKRLHNVESDDEFWHSIYYQRFEVIANGSFRVPELCNKKSFERIRSFASFLLQFMRHFEDLEAYKNYSPEYLSSRYILEDDRSYLHLDESDDLPCPNSSMLALIQDKDLEENVMKELQAGPKKESFLTRLSDRILASTNFRNISVKVQIEESGLSKWWNSLDPTETQAFSRNELFMNCFSVYLRQYFQLCKDTVGIEMFQSCLTNRERYMKDICKASQKLVAHNGQRYLRESLNNPIFSQLETLRRLIKDVAKMEKKTRGKRMPAKYYRARKELERLLSNSSLVSVLPLWIMPTANVTELLPAEFGVFDVVILDEASQSDFSSFPALLRGKKIIVIGDDQQVAPARAYEKDLDHWRNCLDMFPDSTVENILPGRPLFSLFKEVFNRSRVLLREHFRCLPEIIKFCNQEFYQNALIPLRRHDSQHGKASFLEPVDSIYVPDADCKAIGQKRLNEKEQDAIVEKIDEIVRYYDRNPPTEHGKSTSKPSIGVLSLWNIHQAEAIKKKLMSDPFLQGKLEEYRMEFGDAAMFQGSEKDIIILTMVAGPRNAAAEQERHEQSFNVAVSRAKNCLMLFHSVTPADLKKETDMRLKLLNFFNSSKLDRQEGGCQSTDDHRILPGFAPILNKLKAFDISAEVWRIGSTISHDEDIQVIELSAPACRRVAVFLHTENETRNTIKEKYACSCMMVRVGWSVCHLWASLTKLHEEEMVERIKKFWEQENKQTFKRRLEGQEHRPSKRFREDDEPRETQPAVSLPPQSLHSDFCRDFYESRSHPCFQAMQESLLSEPCSSDLSVSEQAGIDEDVIVIDDD